MKKLIIVALSLVGGLLFAEESIQLSRAAVNQLLKFNGELSLPLRAELHEMLAQQAATGSLRLTKLDLLDRGFIARSEAVESWVIQQLESNDIATRQLGATMAWAIAKDGSNKLVTALFNLAKTGSGTAREKALIALANIAPSAITPAVQKLAEEYYANPAISVYERIFAMPILRQKDPGIESRDQLRRLEKNEFNLLDFSIRETFEFDHLNGDEKKRLRALLLERVPDLTAFELLLKHFGQDDDIKKLMLQHFSAFDRLPANRSSEDSLLRASKNDPEFAEKARRAIQRRAGSTGAIPSAKLIPIFNGDRTADLVSAIVDFRSRPNQPEPISDDNIEDWVEWAAHDKSGTLSKMVKTTAQHLGKTLKGNEKAKFFSALLASRGLALPSSADLKEAAAVSFIEDADCWGDYFYPDAYTATLEVPPCHYSESTLPLIETIKANFNRTPDARAKWELCVSKRVERDLKRDRIECEVILFASTFGVLTDEAKRQLINAYEVSPEDHLRNQIATILFPRLTASDLPLIQKSLLSPTAKSDLRSLVERVEALESHRDLFAPAIAANLDAEIKKILDGEKMSAASPCDMICGLRSTVKEWTKGEFFNEAENRASLTEQDFGIYNLIAAFDLKTRPLCPRHEVADAVLKSFHYPPLPYSLAYLNDPETARTTTHSKTVNKLNAVHQIGKLSRGISKVVSPAAAPAITAMEGKARQKVLEQSAETASSLPGVLSNSLVHGLAMAQIYMNSGPSDKVAPTGWVEKVNSGYARYTEKFSSGNGPGGSLFGNYALGLYLSADATPSAELIKQVEVQAAGRLGKCNFPYDRSHIGSDENSSDVYRSVVIWAALAKKGTPDLRDKYQASLALCLKKYFEEPWGPVHSRKDDGKDHHTKTKRQFAPYFYYGTLFLAAQAVMDSNDKALARTLLRRLQLEWNDEKKLFIDSASPLYGARPTYYNPLMALAALPLCVASKK